MATSMAMGENQNIEFKESWRDEYIKWICGFANAQGGKIFIGIDDKGSVKGVSDHKKLLEDIPNKVVSHLGIIVDVNARTQDAKTFLEIQVEPSDVPISYQGVYHYRTGSTKQELRGAALQQFLLKKLGRSWDDVPVEEATLDDIDVAVIKDFLTHAIRTNRLSPEVGNESIKAILQSLHLQDERGKLKAAAILLFGKDPLKFFPHSYFKIGRFGQSDHDLKFQDVIEGNIFQMSSRVIELLRSKYLQLHVTYEGFQRIEKLDYPEEALREAILNSIVHKYYGGTTIQLSVYDDRMLLWNPGTLPDELTVEDLKQKHASHPRNKNLADIFFKAGFIEAWGRGIAKIIDSCKAIKLPEPDIQQSGGGFQITFFKDRLTEAFLSQLGLNDRQTQIIQFLKKEKKVTNRHYQKLFNVSRNTATIDLNELVEKALIQRFGQGAGVYYTL